MGACFMKENLYVAESFAHHQPIPIGHVLLLSLPLVAGVAVLIKARTVADWISEKFD